MTFVIRYRCCACCEEGVDPDLHADGRKDFHDAECMTCPGNRFTEFRTNEGEKQ